MVLVVKNLPARRHKSCRFSLWVGKTIPEEGIATLSRVLAWRIPQSEEPGRLQSTSAESDVTEAT